MRKKKMGNKDHHSTRSSIVGVFSFLPSTKVVEEKGCQCSLFQAPTFASWLPSLDGGKKYFTIVALVVIV
jgi:hypothetical protein